MFLVCLVLNEVFLIVCCNTPNQPKRPYIYFLFLLNFKKHIFTQLKKYSELCVFSTSVT